MEEAIIDEQATVISMDLSKDGKFLLVNTSFSTPELHLWQLERRTIVGKYTG